MPNAVAGTRHSTYNTVIKWISRDERRRDLKRRENRKSAKQNVIDPCQAHFCLMYARIIHGYLRFTRKLASQFRTACQRFKEFKIMHMLFHQCVVRVTHRFVLQSPPDPKDINNIIP